MNKADLLAEIDRALERSGMTAAQASMEAVGNDSLISNMRRKRYGLPSVENLSRLAEVLHLDFRFGERRPQPSNHEAIADMTNYVLVKRIDVELSAGPGAAAAGEDELAPYAFGMRWMKDRGLVAEECRVVGIRGESMEPRLRDGDLVLLDCRARSSFIDMKVYAVVDVDGDIRVKRLERSGNHILLRSDNPRFKTEMRSKAEMTQMNVIGSVVWSDHDWDDRW